MDESKPRSNDEQPESPGAPNSGAAAAGGAPRQAADVANTARGPAAFAAEVEETFVAPIPPGSIPAALASSPDYEVIREISRGGMGVVYLARNRRMDRLEGLKVVKSALLDRPGMLDRFEREMRSAARLSHPNIVCAYSSPPLEGLLAFAMEFVDGIDLHCLVSSRGLLPVANAAYYLSQAARGLQHAFERGMVHRDIKPNNLMLTLDGKKQIVKILDFGLAKATSENSLDAGLTSEGQALGTPHYMAPEQILNAAKADIRADIYSLGCTFYYLLTGAPPFHDRTSTYEILQAHQSAAAPPLNELRPDIPVELAAIVEKMMAKDPTRRFQNPAEVAQELAPFFKQGIKPIPAGAARFSAPPRAQPASETVTSKDAELTRMPSPVVPSSPAAPTEVCRAAGVVGARSRPAPWQLRSIKSWTALALGVLLVLLLGLWAGGFFGGKTESHDEIVATTADDLTTVTLEEQSKVQPASEGNPSEAADEEPLSAPDGELAASVPSVAATDEDASGSAPAVEAAVADQTPAPAPFFNGADLTGWNGLAGYWEVRGGAIVGTPTRGKMVSTFLYSDRTYKDFELRFHVRLKNGIGESGVQVRSRVDDRSHYKVAGPQIEIASLGSDPAPGSVFREPEGKPSHQANRDVVARVWKDDDFNEMHLRCVGDHLTVRLNGLVALDVRQQSMPKEGIIAWQLGGARTPDEVVFKDIQFADLSRGDLALPLASAAVPDSIAPLPTDLKMAKIRYAADTKKAEKALAAQFDREIEGVAKMRLKPENRVHLTDALQAEKAAFDSAKLIPWSRPMRPAVLSYLRDLMSADAAVKKVYDRHISTAIKAKDDAIVESLSSELRAAVPRRLLATWKCAGEDRSWTWRLYSDGTVNEPSLSSGDEKTWALDTSQLLVRFRTAKRPDEMKFRCLVSTDGASLTGETSQNKRFTGTLDRSGN